MDTPCTAAKPSRLDALLARQALVERQIKAIAARQNAARRKQEARARFILGGVVLRLAEADRALLERLCANLPPKEVAAVKASLTKPLPPELPSSDSPP